MRDTLTVINSFIHDMATGVWVAVLFMMYIVSGRAHELADIPRGAAFIGGIMDSLWILAVASMVVVLLTGIIRAVTFKRYGWTGDVARSRKRLLMIKHIILGVMVALGLYLQFILMARV